MQDQKLIVQKGRKTTTTKILSRFYIARASSKNRQSTYLAMRFYNSYVSVTAALLVLSEMGDPTLRKK